MSLGNPTNCLAVKVDGPSILEKSRLPRLLLFKLVDEFIIGSGLLRQALPSGKTKFICVTFSVFTASLIQIFVLDGTQACGRNCGVCGM